MRLASLVMLALLAGPGLARAEREAPVQAASISMPALVVRSLALSYERIAPFDSRFSLGGIAGVRRGALGDYSSTSLALGLEARYWFTGSAPWLRFSGRTLAGFYGGLRLALARTTTTDDVADRAIGTTLTLSETINFGYRFVAWHRLEISPQTGIQLRHDFERRGRLPAWTKLGFSFGLTVGWLF